LTFTNPLLLDHQSQFVTPIDTKAIHYDEMSIFGCFASNLQHYHQALEIVLRNDLPWDRFITHRFPLVEMVKAFAVMEAGQGIKTIISTE
jgi:L-iditol 2-dehydrogenase